MLLESRNYSLEEGTTSDEMKPAMQKAGGRNSKKGKCTDMKGVKADGKELRQKTLM